MIKRILEYNITSEYLGVGVERYLRDKGYPKQALTNLRKEPGLLKINGETVFMNYHFDREGILTILIKEEASEDSYNPIDLPINIIYEDEDIVVLNKAAGMPIHPSINNYDNTLANALAFYYDSKNEPFTFRCINRLDRDTSGISIIAKHYLSAGILADYMRDRQIKREYTAIVEGIVESDSDVIDMPIARVDESVITREVNYDNGERAVTHYRVIKRDTINNVSLVKLTLDTGRTHQIRVHMKAIGHPLIGDFLYNPENTQMKRQALHAGHISFIHPITGERMEFVTELPDDMKWIEE